MAESTAHKSLEHRHCSDRRHLSANENPPAEFTGRKDSAISRFAAIEARLGFELDDGQNQG